MGRDEVVLLIKNDPTKKWWLVENQSGQRGFAPITHLITMDGSPAASSVKLNRSASGSRLQRRSSSTSLGAYPVSIAPNAMGPQYSGAWPAAMMQRRMSGRMPPPPFISERAAEAARRDHEAQMMAMQLQAQQNALVAQQQQIALQQQQLELAKAQQGMYSAYQGAQKVAAEVNTAVSGQARVNAIEE